MGISALEIGHRTSGSRAYSIDRGQSAAAARHSRQLPRAVPAGGSRLQFSMVPMNLSDADRTADYILTARGARRPSRKPAAKGAPRVAYTASPRTSTACRQAAELKIDPKAAYVHFTSNETIQGVQFPTEPDTGGVPLVCDSSSDIFCRPLECAKYGLLYACAQKNAGPAGVTIVIIRDDLLARSQRQPAWLCSTTSRTSKKTRCRTRRPCFADLYREAGDQVAAERRRRPGEDARTQSAARPSCCTT